MPGITKAKALKLLESEELHKALTVSEVMAVGELLGSIKADDFTEEDMMEVDLDDLPKVVFEKLYSRWRTLESRLWGK